MRDMTNFRAAQLKDADPKDFYASNWKELTTDELKAFVGCLWNTQLSSDV